MTKNFNKKLICIFLVCVHVSVHVRMCTCVCVFVVHVCRLCVLCM